jgi:hypothetical protein
MTKAGHCCSDDAAELASKVEWRENCRQAIDEYQVCHFLVTTASKPEPGCRKAGRYRGKKERSADGEA